MRTSLERNSLRRRSVTRPLTSQLVSFLFLFYFLRSIRCLENIEFAHGELFNMPERLPRREHFWQLALAYRRYREWSIPRELVCPNFLDLREFIIIFALRNNRASLASFVLSSVTSSHSLLLFTHARDENYSTTGIR